MTSYNSYSHALHNPRTMSPPSSVNNLFPTLHASATCFFSLSWVLFENTLRLLWFIISTLETMTLSSRSLLTNLDGMLFISFQEASLIDRCSHLNKHCSTNLALLFNQGLSRSCFNSATTHHHLFFSSRVRHEKSCELVLLMVTKDNRRW